MSKTMKKFIDHIVNSTDTFKELGALYVGLILFSALMFSIAEAKPFGDALLSRWHPPPVSPVERQS